MATPNYYAYDHGLPCRNPNCGSKGKPHPNCKCWSAQGGEKHFSQGGYCSSARVHQKDCEHYREPIKADIPLFAGGGAVREDGSHAPAHPNVTVSHAAVSHGLLGLIKKIGRSGLSDPEKHQKHVEKIRGHIFENNHEKAAEEMHGQPVAGRASKENLKQIAHRIGPELMANDPHPDGLRASVDYLGSAIEGHSSLKNKMGQVIGNDKLDLDRDEKGIESLKEFLQEAKEKPEVLLDLGENLSHYMPDQTAHMSAMVATAVDYLNAIKPQPLQATPLDEPVSPDRAALSAWNRHLEIAENPLTVLKFVKEGTLLPQDLVTLKTIYPGLAESIISNASEAVIAAREKKKTIPYRQRQSLSMIFGSPIDASMSPDNMQAIIKSAGNQQAAVQNAKNQKSSQKLTAAQLKQTDKVDRLYETPLEQSQINKKD